MCSSAIRCSSSVSDRSDSWRWPVRRCGAQRGSSRSARGRSAWRRRGKYGATDFISYKNGPIDEQVLALTGGKGVDCAIIAGGDVDTFIPVVKILKPGGRIGNVNYLGSGDYVKIPRADWGVGMGHKLINGGLMPGGRLRMEKLSALMTSGRLDVKPLITHVFDGWDKLPQALQLMKDKPQDLIKPVVRL